MMSSLEIISAVLDANVLYAAPLRDYLLYLAVQEIYYPLWTDKIQEEWARSLLKARPDIDRATIEAVQRSMDKEFSVSKVTDYESIIDTLTLPDPDDRHVVAAAIKQNAPIIVTANLKDFPQTTLTRYDIRAMHPDDFILECIDNERAKAIQALKNQVKSLKNPPIPTEKVLENLKRCGLVKSVEKLKTHLRIKN